MLHIDSTAALARAIDQPIDPRLRYLLIERLEQLGQIEGAGSFIVTCPSDTLVSIECVLGFPIATNLIDGTRFGEPDFEPSREYARHHGGWVEVVFILSDDGFAHVLFVPDRDDIDPTLRKLTQLAEPVIVQGEAIGRR